MKRTAQLSRRTILREIGTSIALPWLEAMKLIATWAGERRPAVGGALSRRMAFPYVPNGVHMAAWTSQQVGSRFTVPATLKPLEAYKDELLGRVDNNWESLGG
jgi:hypothetical protein